MAVKRYRRRATVGQPALFADLHMMIGASVPAEVGRRCPITGGALHPPAPVMPEPEGPEEETESTWYQALNLIRSRGSMAERPGSMAALHAHREVTLSQFFTPNSVVRFIWDLITPSMGEYGRGKFTIFDNSFGSGRMFQFADPANHYLVGCEIDGALVEEVSAAAKAAGFEFQFERGSLEEFRARRDAYHFGLINPPFSIQIDNPLTEAFETGSYGRYGAKSSHKSHLYAIEQARAACDVVVAVVPRTLADAALDPKHAFHGALHSVYHLPRGTFREENTEVEVSILLFGDSQGRAWDEDRAPVRVFTLPDLVMREEYSPGELSIHYRSWSFKELGRAEERRGSRVTKLPVTGDKRVRVCHSGRRVVLKFGCGAAEAKVWNRVWEAHLGYRDKRDGRAPKNTRFTGEGKMDLENYLAQPDPLQSLQEFADSIRAWGYEPEVDPGIIGYLTRRMRRNRLLQTPLRQSVYQVDGGLRGWLGSQTTFKGVCTKEHPLHWYSYGGSRVPSSAEVTFTRTQKRGGAVYSYEHEQRASSMTEEQLTEHYEFPEWDGQPDGWVVRSEGLQHQFPEEWRWMEAQARRTGIDQWLTWGYQWHDVIECGLRRGNTIIAWEMGLGKARLALSLCLIGGGKSNVVLVESRLIDEMRKEIKGLGIDDAEWQVIDSVEDCANLRRINLLSYNKLRTAEKKSEFSRRKRYPIADALRRRVHTMVVDEGHNLKNVTSDQHRSAIRVAARQRYILTGTPIDNYPRDILPLMQFVAGDGVAHQPFGNHQPYLEDKNLRSMNRATRGVDVFREMFVTLTWVTNEFADNLTTGAKREIPKIKDIWGFQQMCAPIVKRRLMVEPEVAAYVNIPKAVYHLQQVPWDVDHLKHYVQVSEWFIEWYKSLSESDKRNNLIALLAKIGAVFEACNYPQGTKLEDVGAYAALTSKQRYAFERLKTLVAEGRKVIFLAQSPQVLEMFGRLLQGEGIEYVMFHGALPIKKRVADMDKRFREGSAPVLLASKGCLQTGYNIYQADRVLFYDRAWTPKIEQQAAARALRPQQTKEVHVEFMELEGSIDMYMRQMVEFKATTCKAGLDYGEDTTEAEDFKHIETILGAFVEDFEAKHGIKISERVRAAEAAAAAEAAEGEEELEEVAA